MEIINYLWSAVNYLLLISVIILVIKFIKKNKS
jgi:heme exporter protein D